MAQIQVRDQFGAPVVLINVRMGRNGQDVDGAEDDRFTDFAGNTAFVHPLDTDARGYDLFVNQRNVNPAYVATQVHADNFAADIPITLSQVPPAPPPPLTRLSIPLGSRKFVDENGKTVFLKMVDEYCLFARYARGEDIAPVLQELHDLNVGINCLQVFGMCDGADMQTGIDCYPQNIPNYYSKMVAFCGLCETYGFYVYWVCFVNAQKIMPDEPQQQTHWTGTWQTLRDHCANTIVGLGNEQDQHDNGVDRSTMSRPSDIAASIGSNGGGEPCYLPPWDFSDYHSRRDPHEKVIADADLEELIGGYAGYTGTGQLSLSGENVHFAEDAIPGKRENDPTFAEIFAQASYPTAAFAYLSDNTLRGELLQPMQQQCLVAAMSALPNS